MDIPTENQAVEIPSVSQQPKTEVGRTITLWDYFSLLPAIIGALTPLILALINSRNKDKNSEQEEK
ncbi:MAG: hypothetical protein ACFB2X_02945 [Rivularia sp. (in: cyanobacteria)]